MDVLQFIAEIVKALAWPLVALFVIWYFRDKWAALFEHTTEFKAFGTEAKFDRKMLKVEAEVTALQVEEKLLPPPTDHIIPPRANTIPTPDVPNSAEENTRFDEKPIVSYLMLSADPASGFQLGRTYLERALVDQYFKMSGTVPGLLVPMDMVVDQLEEKRFISAKMRRTLKELLTLANQAANGRFVPSFESAKAFVNAVQSTTDLMKERSKRLHTTSSS